ncbi:hypothetical protein B0T19DRAFT_403066 [Cercophora scortea]|uniref:Uncharacterized protein n=1 Tax=Cercophora scortea TaxID=314031 RepID=A0AAE0I8T8_9PEZI|nr:hypothetical protein B0T19DRAFT_403066 [Cercophora scortea]
MTTDFKTPPYALSLLSGGSASVYCESTTVNRCVKLGKKIQSQPARGLALGFIIDDAVPLPSRAHRRWAGYWIRNQMPVWLAMLAAFLTQTLQKLSGSGAVLDFLLAEVENLTGKVVFVLAGYNKQMETF